MVHEGALLARIVRGTLFGAVIGYERDIHGRPAGFRTHLLVALASTTFMVVSTHFVYYQHYGKDDPVAIDTSRIAASVVTGVGFLGAGAILRTGRSIQGLTTAAGLWLVAAIGLATGGGMYRISVAATLLGFIALTILRRLEGKDDDALRRRVTLVLDAGAPPLAGVLSILSARGISVAPVEYDKRLDEERIQVTFLATLPKDAGAELLVESVEGVSGVRRVCVELPAG
jgi:putative Mg2+ transporter-C (MgtC) family protein